jgi:D-alanyl-lipoteichoic acid acyltransferase DltB (MBOAT superfamily)
VPLSSATYFIFLTAIFFLYWPVARVRTLGLAVLLFANYFFYARWGIAYLVLIPAASTCDFLIGLGLQYFQNSFLRRLLVGLSLAVNLGLLVSLKFQIGPARHWVLPLALSFYAFQALTYTLDLYRRDAKGTTSYLAHLAAVSFFPTTLAGPITRVSDLLIQFVKSPMLGTSESGRALFLIGLGLVKKLLIADCLGDNLVNRIFDLPRLYSGFEVVVGVWAYALELYYDFSGYTDIAIGSALLLGIKLPSNFDMPYSAMNVTDFWRRWHISFSNWLRDYLYFSLPGLRSRWKIFAYLNLVITMMLGGLWHGVSWTFAIWGLLHGVALAVTRAWQTWRGRRPAPALWKKVLCAFATSQFVCLTWIFFRAPDLNGALTVLSRIGSLTFATDNITPTIAGVMILATAGHFFPKKWFARLQDLYSAVPFYAQAAAMAAVVAVIESLMGRGAAPFVYSRF